MALTTCEGIVARPQRNVTLNAYICIMFGSTWSHRGEAAMPGWTPEQVDGSLIEAELAVRACVKASKVCEQDDLWRLIAQISNKLRHMYIPIPLMVPLPDFGDVVRVRFDSKGLFVGLEIVDD